MKPALSEDGIERGAGSDLDVLDFLPPATEAVGRAQAAARCDAVLILEPWPGCWEELRLRG